MVVNDYFGPKITNRPHATHNYIPRKHKFEIDYYRQTYFPIKTGSYTRKIWKNQVKK